MQGRRLAWGLLLWALVQPALAQKPRLSDSELAACAAKVHHLREESARLHQELARLDRERERINKNSEAIDASPPGRDAMALHEARRAHDAAAAAFNREIAQLRRALAAVNAVKQDYDRTCSGRPYNRAALEALPAAQQSAMRAGLADVRVPYLDPAASPLP